MFPQINELRLRLKSLLHCRRLGRDLKDELAFHLALREEQLRATSPGSPTSDPRSAARRDSLSISATPSS